MKTSLLLTLAALSLATLFASSPVVAQDYWIYFGTSTDRTTPEMDAHGTPRSEGVYVGRFNSETGEISDVRLALKAASSGYLASLPEKNLLYFVGTVDGRKGWANAVACKIDPATGDLTVINEEPTTGQGVCHTDVSADGKFLTAANYSSGDFSVFKLNEDGSLGPVTAKYFREGSGPLARRQSHPYGHSSYFVTLDGVRRLFMSDLGSDRIYVARVNEETGALEEDPAIPSLATPAGAGPRHLAFATDDAGRFVVFSINELDSTFSAFQLDFKAGESKRLGTWTTLQEEFRKGLTDEETLVDGKKYLYGNKTAAIAYEKLPSGKNVVYATNRGQNTVVAFNVDALLAKDADEGSDATLIQRVSTNGSFPRFAMIDPTGKFYLVSNKKSGSVYTYRIDQKTGELSLLSEEPTRIAWVIGGAFAPIRESK